MSGNPLRLPPEETLREIRRRARQGLSLRTIDVRDTSLYDRARRDFGSWSRAVIAAGLRPGTARRGSGRAKPRGPKKKAKLTRRLLESDASNRALARMCGLDRRSVREHRARLGIHRDRRPPARAWVRRLRRLLGRVPDQRIADRAGVSQTTVAKVRLQLGIPAAHGPRDSTGSATAILSRLEKRVGRARLLSALRRLDPVEERILRARHFRRRRVPLQRLADELGYAYTYVCRLDREAAEHLDRLLRGRSRRGGERRRKA